MEDLNSQDCAEKKPACMVGPGDRDKSEITVVKVVQLLWKMQGSHKIKGVRMTDICAAASWCRTRLFGFTVYCDRHFGRLFSPVCWVYDALLWFGLQNVNVCSILYMLYWVNVELELAMEKSSYGTEGWLWWWMHLCAGGAAHASLQVIGHKFYILCYKNAKWLSCTGYKLAIAIDFS